MENCQFMVFVQCSTYNHSKYINDTMDGFCMQQTNFPFVCGIIDDASSDGEQDVLLQYLKEHFRLVDNELYKREETADYIRIFTQHNTNDNCFFLVVLLKSNHYQRHKDRMVYIDDWKNSSKYIALCEGDDCWIHPQKLQMQVDFMEQNQNCSMCFSDVFRKNCDTSKFIRPFSHTCNNEVVNNIFDKEKLFYALINRDCRIPTLTVLYRKTFYDLIKADLDKKFMMGDTPLWLGLSQKGRFKYFEEVFGIYCIHTGSATHDGKTRLHFTMNAKSMCVYYCNKFNYPVPQKIKNEYNRAYLQLLLHGETPESNAINDYLFPDGVLSWTIDKRSNKIKHRNTIQFRFIRTLINIENCLYENKIRFILGLKALKKERRANGKN